MKVRFRFISCFSLAIMVFLLVCGCTPKEKQFLKEPENISSEDRGRTLTWSPVENASGYSVLLNGEVYDTKENKLSLEEMGSAGETFSVQVKANGDGITYFDSGWTEQYVCELLPFDESFGYETDGMFTYSLLEDGTYSIGSTDEAFEKERLILPDSYKNIPITKIQSGSFTYLAYSFFPYADSKIKSIQFPAHLKEIEDGSFQAIGLLERVDFPEGLTKIGDGAFSGKCNIKDLTLPDGLTYLGAGAFRNSPWYNNLFEKANKNDYVCFQHILLGYKGEFPYGTQWNSVPAGIPVIAGGAFQAQKGLTSVKVPESVLHMGGFVFSACPDLQRVEVHGGIKEVPYGAFSDCENLTEVEMQEGIQKICDASFLGCANLERVHIPDSVITLGTINPLMEGVFEYCTKLREVSFSPASQLREIGASAFAHCEALAINTLPPRLRVIRHGAFLACRSLTGMVLPEGVQTIELCSFYGTPLQYLVLPKSVKEIDKSAFELHVNVVNNNETYVMNNNVILYYGGTEEDWQALEPNIYPTNLTLFKAPRYYYSEEKPQAEGNFWHFESDGITPIVWN